MKMIYLIDYIINDMELKGLPIDHIKLSQFFYDQFSVEVSGEVLNDRIKVTVAVTEYKGIPIKITNSRLEQFAVVFKESESIIIDTL